MKRWLTRIFFICMCFLFVTSSDVKAKKITKGNVKKEIAQQKNKCRDLRKQYSAAKKEEKKYKKLYQKEKGKYSAIILGTVKSRSPLVINSNYIASPLQGWFLVKGGSAGLGPWVGEVKLTGEYYQWKDHRCRVVQYCKNGTPAYRKYKQATTNMKKIEDKLGKANSSLSYLKGLPKSKLRLKNQFISVDEKKKMKFGWNRYQNREKSKWKVSNSRMVRIVKSGSNTVTLKGKKRGTVTLTGTAAISGKKSKCKIKIYDKVKQLVVTSADGSGTYSNGSSITIGMGKQFQIKGKCLPSTSLQSVTYTSADKKIATVNAQGLITGKQVGQTTVKVSDAAGKKTQNITIVVSNRITSMTPEKNAVSVQLNDKSGDIRGTGIDKEQKSKYWYMQQLSNANPTGMFFLDFSVQMDQANAATTDILTCTSSDTGVVVPMFVYHTSRGNNFPDDRDDYNYLSDPGLSLDFCKYPLESPQYDAYCPNPGGRLFVGIVGAGRATITLKSQSGVTCSWDIQVQSGTQDQYPGGDQEQNADVMKLKELIAEQQALGADVSEDLNSGQYEWNDEGRLTGIYWDYVNLQGSIDFRPFAALERLQCSENQLSAIYVNESAVLQFLSCDNNQMGSLDVSGCLALETLYCNDNQLESLDVSGCSALEILECTNNQISTLDVSGCLVLYELNCDPDVVVTGRGEKQETEVTKLQEIIAGQIGQGAQVSEDLDSKQYKWNQQGRLVEINWEEMGLQGELDLSAFTALQTLQCAANQLTGICVEGCSELQVLNCTNNKIGSLDISDCPALVRLSCSGNSLESLDVSGCLELQELYCTDNLLESLDISQNENLLEFECDDSVVVTS